MYLALPRISIIIQGSNVLVKFSVNNEENIVKEPVRFMVLNMSDWEDVLNKVEALDEEELCAFSYDLSSLTPIFYYDRNSMQPEVAEIINEYDPIEIKNKWISCLNIIRTRSMLDSLSLREKTELN